VTDWMASLSSPLTAPLPFLNARFGFGADRRRSPFASHQFGTCAQANPKQVESEQPLECQAV
jgi:hypothetical protein